MNQATQPSNGYLRLLRQNKNFRNLYLARTISLLGDWLNTLAILVLLSEMTHKSDLAFGLVLVIKMLPHALFASFAGALADRYDRKRIMIFADLTRVFIVLTFLTLENYPAPFFAYCLMFLQTAVGAFFEPARNSLLPDIVHKEDLVSANALSAATWSLMLTTGMLIGGIATELFGWQLVIILDATTYLVSANLLLRIKTKKVTENTEIRPHLGIKDIVESIQYLKSAPRIFLLASLKGLYCIGGAASLLLAVFGEQIYQVGTTAAPGIALLFTARGLGTASGPIIARFFVKNDEGKMEKIIFPAFLTCIFFYTLFSQVHSLYWALPCIFLAHLGSSTIWVFSTVLLQREVAAQYRGRVFGFELAAFTLTISLSTLLYSLALHYEIFSPHQGALLLALTWLIPASVWKVGQRKWR